MGISVVNYTAGDNASSAWGVLREGSIYPLQGHYVDHREVMACYFSERETFDACIEQTPLKSDSIRFNSPISQNVQLFCQGLNYADHRSESGLSSAGDEENLIFMKAGSSICGPNETIMRPRDCKLLDYEIELALVMKEDIAESTQIDETDLSKYVGALVLCNDVSARDIMFGSPMLQWFRYLMDPDDFRQLLSLQLTLKLNGEVKQSASTDLLIHRPGATLAEISTFANLAAGDCLLTGTPGGVLVGGNLKAALAIILNLKNDKKRRKKFTQAQLAQTRFLEPGDVLELSIKTPDGAIDLGSQRNEIADI